MQTLGKRQTGMKQAGTKQTGMRRKRKQQTDGTGKVVGSLILSPVLHVDGCCSETCQTGLFLGDDSCEMDVGESFETCVFDHETVFETNNSFFHETDNSFLHETNNSFLHDMSFARLDFSKNREFQTTFGLSGSGTSDVDTSQPEQHRRQGHMPFNTQCLECNRGGSVFQHSRKKEGSKDVELQADFCFLSQTGEVAGGQNPCHHRAHVKMSGSHGDWFR